MVSRGNLLNHLEKILIEFSWKIQELYEVSYMTEIAAVKFVMYLDNREKRLKCCIIT